MTMAIPTSASKPSPVGGRLFRSSLQTREVNLFLLTLPSSVRMGRHGRSIGVWESGRKGIPKCRYPWRRDRQLKRYCWAARMIRTAYRRIMYGLEVRVEVEIDRVRQADHIAAEGRRLRYLRIRCGGTVHFDTIIGPADEDGGVGELDDRFLAGGLQGFERVAILYDIDGVHGVADRVPRELYAEHHGFAGGFYVISHHHIHFPILVEIGVEFYARRIRVGADADAAVGEGIDDGL